MADAHEHYTYEAFLRAVAKFPAFCNESNGPLNYDLDSTCKREIAALFAHMMNESEEMTILQDPDCACSEDA